MTEREQFEAMLKAHAVDYETCTDIDDDDVDVGIEIRGGKRGIVDAFGHCFCEFRFNAAGTLVGIQFGY